MKKLIILVGILMLSSLCYANTVISVDPFVTPNDVTIAHLETFRTTIVNNLNSFDGGNIQSNTVTAEQLDANTNPENFRNEAFNDWVYSGLLLPTTSGTLTATTPSGIAYISGKRVVKDATNKTYTATKWTFVDLSKDGTYTYTEQNIDSGEPAITSNSIRLGRVSTDATEVTAIRDDRILSISLDSNQSDHHRTGLTITVVTPDSITIEPGVVYHGTQRIIKRTDTSLSLGTAGDWATGGSQRATSTYGYIVVNSAGNIKLSTTAPTVHDLTEGTAGKLRYSSISSAYWRVIGWFYMNSTGSGNIDYWGYGCFKDGMSVYNMVLVSGETDITTTSNTYTDMTDMEINFYSSGNPLLITFSAPVNTSSSAGGFFALDIDGVDYAETSIEDTDNAARQPVFTQQVIDLPQGTHTIKTQWHTTGAVQISQTAGSWGNRLLMVREE